VSRLPLGPGSGIPAWIEALDQATFGRTWGALEDTEQIWTEGESGFIRWEVVPGLGEAQLLRLAVDPEARRRGVGRRLLEASVRDLAAQGVKTLYLEVRASNVAAQALYDDQGWTRQGVRKGYYLDGEDAVLYVRMIGS
jgi:ribosomal-protein-alanine N-acetyltransferase